MQITNRIYNTSQEFRSIVSEYYEHDNNNLHTYLKELDTYVELCEYLKNTFSDIIEKINLERLEKSKKIIEIAKNYILKNYHQEISLKSVSERVKLNPSYFSNLYKKETGMNFSEFLMEVRINEAKKLLAMPDKMIYEIGQMVGYEESVSFGRAFKKIVGVSPADYRKIIK